MIEFEVFTVLMGHTRLNFTPRGLDTEDHKLFFYCHNILCFFQKYNHSLSVLESVCALNLWTYRSQSSIKETAIFNWILYFLTNNNQSKEVLKHNCTWEHFFMFLLSPPHHIWALLGSSRGQEVCLVGKLCFSFQNCIVLFIPILQP